MQMMVHPKQRHVAAFYGAWNHLDLDHPQPSPSPSATIKPKLTIEQERRSLSGDPRREPNRKELSSELSNRTSKPSALGNKRQS
ncbi:hypothetical protein AND_002881 [Anopheles darlingi]|uniref:Uncharacterized protein n=1 Tax=Anopheles darlingi TaxID=43151 RepID=W5JR17_ANODA|nr:hypothetical protein AND_002881 [Anopheles darlingi]